MRMPVLFVGHGSPMNAIEDNAFHRSWRELAERLPRPDAILCMSAHWETRGIAVTSSERPSTIHDFGGFPQALFDVEYRAPGNPQLARRTADLLSSPDARLDPERGLDHGAWSVLLPMYPDADVSVVQLSLDSRQPGAFHYALAKKLAVLRDEGVLVLATGNIVHNLGVFRFQDPQPYDWAVRFDAAVVERIERGEHEALIDFDSLGDAARLSIPTPEHYLPLLYALALQEPGESVAFWNRVVLSSISMTSLVIGS